MALIWQGAARADEVVDLGPLALIHPLLHRLDRGRSGRPFPRPEHAGRLQAQGNS
jgi:hypothetical protein